MLVDSPKDATTVLGGIDAQKLHSSATLFHRADPDDAGFRARLAAAADERQATLVADLRTAGLELHTVTTDEDLVRALFRLTQLRRGRRAGAGPRR